MDFYADVSPHLSPDSRNNMGMWGLWIRGHTMAPLRLGHEACERAECLKSWLWGWWASGVERVLSAATMHCRFAPKLHVWITLISDRQAPPHRTRFVSLTDAHQGDRGLDVEDWSGNASRPAMWSHRHSHGVGARGVECSPFPAKRPKRAVRTPDELTVLRLPPRNFLNILTLQSPVRD